MHAIYHKNYYYTPLLLGTYVTAIFLKPGLVHTMPVILIDVLRMVTQEQLATLYIRVKIMLVNRDGACLLVYARKMKNFNFFGASDARRVNSRRESVASVLSKKRQVKISNTSSSETSIVCTLFSLNQHTSMLVVGIRLLAYKHRVYGVLPTALTTATRLCTYVCIQPWFVCLTKNVNSAISQSLLKRVNKCHSIRFLRYIILKISSLACYLIR